MLNAYRRLRIDHYAARSSWPEFQSRAQTPTGVYESITVRTKKFERSFASSAQRLPASYESITALTSADVTAITLCSTPTGVYESITSTSSSTSTVQIQECSTPTGVYESITRDPATKAAQSMCSTPTGVYESITVPFAYQRWVVDVVLNAYRRLRIDHQMPSYGRDFQSRCSTPTGVYESITLNRLRTSGRLGSRAQRLPASTNRSHRR